MVGIADKKPAAASSGIESSWLVRFGVKVYMRALEVSYAYVVRSVGDIIAVKRLTQKDTAKMGVTPSKGGTMPRYILGASHEIYENMQRYLQKRTQLHHPALVSS